MATPPSPQWIVRRKPMPAPRLRLFCFPYAGAGTTIYHTWPDAMAPHIEVCAVLLPGRETRLGEPPLSELPPLITQLAAAMAPYISGEQSALPFAFFGHSFGALVAYELTLALRRSGSRLPVKLLVSGRAGPRCPQRYPAISGLSGAAFADAVSRRYGGIPPALMKETELLNMLLPALQADLKITESYTHRGEPPLAIPIHALGGHLDSVAPEADVRMWQSETSAEFHMQLFPGGHFFVNDVREQVLRMVRAVLAAA